MDWPTLEDLIREHPKDIRIGDYVCDEQFGGMVSGWVVGEGLVTTLKLPCWVVEEATFQGPPLLLKESTRLGRGYIMRADYEATMAAIRAAKEPTR